jgi:hypothetical protein
LFHCKIVWICTVGSACIVEENVHKPNFSFISFIVSFDTHFFQMHQQNERTSTINKKAIWQKAHAAMN